MKRVTLAYIYVSLVMHRYHQSLIFVRFMVIGNTSSSHGMLAGHVFLNRLLVLFPIVDAH
jgi:hypothetical protein